MLAILRPRALCVLLLLVVAASRAADPVPVIPFNEADMAQLRVLGWRLLVPFTDRSQGLPNPSLWFRSDDVFFRATSLPVQKSQRIGIAEAAEHHRVTFIGEPKLYEMTFFNDVAKNFIRSQSLYLWETTTVLEEKLVRDVQFPRDSKVAKTFWYVIEKGQSLNINGWQWSASKLRDPGKANLSLGDLVPICVADVQNKGKVKEGCVAAEENFYSIRVTDPSDFSCAEPCPSIKAGNLLILVGLHVASKQASMPDWLWATFWWHGGSATVGESWTCRDAQRQAAIGGSPQPWSNYAMDVTASLWMQKPRLKDDDPCGAPGKISGEQEWMATYNPFVEGRMPEGLKSSCIECHSRASTNSRGVADDAPPISKVGGPSLRCFEGQIRLDYLWSLRSHLRTIAGRNDPEECY